MKKKIKELPMKIDLESNYDVVDIEAFVKWEKVYNIDMDTQARIG